MSTSQQAASPKADRNLLWRGDYKQIAWIGCVLLLAYSVLVPRLHSYAHDGRQLYVGTKVFAQGGNPYSLALLRQGYVRFTPEGEGDTDYVMAQIHLPATFAMLTPLAWMPWPLFCWFHIVVTAFCIPLIAHLCLRFLLEGPSARALWLGSFGIALFPPTWQNIALGQVALPVLVCLLLAARATNDDRALVAGGCALLSLLKPTLALPLLAYLLVVGSRKIRSAIILSMLVFLGLNVLAVARIGPSAFRSAYQHNLTETFVGGGVNDVDGYQSGARVDMEVLLVRLPGAGAGVAPRVLVSLLLLAPWIASLRRSERLPLAGISASCLLALLLFYHRTYDAVLILPALFLLLTGFSTAKAGKARLVFALALLACLVSLGNHNLLDTVLRPFGARQPVYFRSLAVLGAYLALMWMWVSSGGDEPLCRHRRQGKRSLEEVRYTEGGDHGLH